MARYLPRMLWPLLAFALWAGPTAAAEIRVVTVGALRMALEPIATQYQTGAGNTLAVTYTNPANIAQTLAEGSFDVIIAATSSVQERAAAGAIAAATRIRLARTGIGISIREGAPKPDLSSPEAFRNAVLAARNVVYTNPETPNGSGILTRALLEEAGLLEAVLAKGMMSGLAAGRDLIAAGEYEMGFFNISEAISPGVVLAGPVPDPYQRYTDYDAAVMQGVADAAAAASFIDHVARAEMRAAWAEGGIELTAEP